jgi:sulfur relay protein TusB/DsrH
MSMGFFVSDYAMCADTLDRLVSDDSGIILVANGVYHASIKEGGNASALLEKSSKLYVLSEDIKTRGIDESKLDSRVKVVDYAGLVDVVFEKFEKIVWL